MCYFILLLLPLGTGVMSSKGYSIKTCILNMGGGKVSSAAYEVWTAVGQPTAIGEAVGDNYKARLGFLAHQAGIKVGVMEQRAPPLVTCLFQNRPNPSMRGVKIPYSLARASNVSLKVYDVAGRVVRTLVNGRMLRGKYIAKWDSRDRDGKSMPAGVYFYRLVVDGKSIGTRKLVLVK
ncbi:T9SS type A sorting domain-containing protein [candidate division WOR-3 bacterium]|nr:T9SS type A sorting domain-containing protein [candidate division WOR-3 bacterium]